LRLAGRDGAYWDDPGAHLLQRLGVGSVINVFALSFLLLAEKLLER
jgi:hypothetical protein